MRRIEVYLTTGFEILHWAPVVRALMDMEQDVSFISPQESPKSKLMGWDDADRTELLLCNLDLPWTKQPDFRADCVLTIQSEDVVSAYKHTKIRMQYGVGLIPPIQFQPLSRPFDYHFVHGHFGQRVQFNYHATPSPMLPANRVKVIGYPKFDHWFTTFDSSWHDAQYYEKPVLLWLPTWGRSSSIDRYADAIFALKDKYDIWVRPHHGTVHWERERMTRLAEGPCRILDFDGPPEPAFAAASVVLADLSSGAFGEAVFLKKKVVGLTTQHEIENALCTVPIPGCVTSDGLEAAMDDNGLYQEPYFMLRDAFRHDLFDSTEGADGPRTARTIVEILDASH